MQKGNVLYQGKAKTLYASEDEALLIMAYRDDATAFNARKKATLPRKGLVNNHFNAFIMHYLESQGIKTHFLTVLNDTESLVRKVDIIPLECVVRNVAAGSLCKRLGIERGRILSSPLFECYLKNDALSDPLLNDDHVRLLNIASSEEVALIKKWSVAINKALLPLFLKAHLTLVDFKVEFGRLGDDIILGDEFTPDGCRLWDTKTGRVFDKDRFREDLGNVIESYEEVAERLQIRLP